MRKKRVVVAMSGGVDSSAAAAVLKESGYEVIGVTMNLFFLPKEVCFDRGLRSCCGRQAVEDAHRVALALGIPHYVADFRREFEKKVIEDFCAEYMRGRTPNPCIRCNQHIKFGLLMEKARSLGADYLATGHHGRVEFDERSDRSILRKGRDTEKDQSYFLYMMTQDALSRTLMPVGWLLKEEVRQIAGELGLSVAQKPESQEICFAPDGDYARFLKNRIPDAFRPGLILDPEGRPLGEHSGIARFTIGQRRGMGIAASHPLHVLSIDAARNAVIVGRNEDLYKKSLVASDVTWISGEEIRVIFHLKARIRYKHAEAEALLTQLDEGRVRVDFEKPQRAVTPGQAVVFYDGDVVLGGGTIESACS